MNVRCPKCKATDVRIHASRVSIAWRPRWRWFGHLVPRFHTEALEVSCGPCFYQFVVWPDAIEAIETQRMHDLLAEAKAKADAAAAKGPESSNDGGREPRKFARPAPDPRTRRR